MKNKSTDWANLRPDGTAYRTPAEKAGAGRAAAALNRPFSQKQAKATMGDCPLCIEHFPDKSPSHLELNRVSFACNRQHSVEDHIDNWPLYAAAPALLAALKDALAFLDRPDITTYEWYKLAPEHVGRFRRAIAAAEAQICSVCGFPEGDGKLHSIPNNNKELCSHIEVRNYR